MHNSNECLNFSFMGDREELARIDAELTARRWSWAEFARSLGESPQAVQNWKDRGIPGNKRYKVAQALGKSVEWLVTGTKVPMYQEGESVLFDSDGKIQGREPVYPTEPFNRFSELAKLWPYLTDDSQVDFLDQIKRLVRVARYGQSPPPPTLKIKKARSKHR